MLLVVVTAVSLDNMYMISSIDIKDDLHLFSYCVHGIKIYMYFLYVKQKIHL